MNTWGFRCTIKFEFISTAVVFGCSMLARCFTASDSLPQLCDDPTAFQGTKRDGSENSAAARDRERERESWRMSWRLRGRTEREVTALTEEKNNEQRIAEVRNTDNTDCLQTRDAHNRVHF